MCITMHKNNITNCMVGISVDLIRVPRAELRGVTVDDVARYAFYKANLQRGSVIVLEPKSGVKVTPLQCSKVALRLSQVLRLPIAFKFDRLEYYERMRFLQKDVYFIAGDNMYLPNLILTAQSPKKVAKKLSAAAQYLILHHLQKENLEGLSVSEISELVPYSYVSVAKAVEVLEDLSLCKCEKDSSRSKRLYFEKTGKEYWGVVRQYLVSPVKKVFYCDRIVGAQCPKAGISALAEYSFLAEDNQKTVAVYDMDCKDIQFEGMNDFDGPVEVEVWKYPHVALSCDVVDKLSLYLSLDADQDPRVEKENNNMLEGIWKEMN